MPGPPKAAPWTPSASRSTSPFSEEVGAPFKGMARESANMKRGESAQMPAGILFHNRLQFGFFSFLARLDVEVDYGAIEEGLIEWGWNELRKAKGEA